MELRTNASLAVESSASMGSPATAAAAVAAGAQSDHTSRMPATNAHPAAAAASDAVARAAYPPASGRASATCVWVRLHDY